MNKELVIKKCLKCGAIVKVIEDCDCDDCGILCCGKLMIKMLPNTSDGAVEKHVPSFEFDGDTLRVSVNHVMEEEHFIEWICLKTEEKEEFVYLKPNMDAVAVFTNVNRGTLYAYCNKHGLWKVEI